MKKLLGVVALGAAAFLMTPSVSYAGPFNFTTLGANNTALNNSETVGGVTATAFVLTQSGTPTVNDWTNTPTGADPILWLRNQTNDHGLGVCAAGEDCVNGGGDVNEVDNAGTDELIRLDKGTTGTWTSLWVSSLDSNNGAANVEDGRLTWSNNADPDGATLGTFTFAFGTGAGQCNIECDILTLAAAAGFDATARYVFFTAGGDLVSDTARTGSNTNNDYLVWKGAVSTPEASSTLLLAVSMCSAVVYSQVRRVRRRRNV